MYRRISDEKKKIVPVRKEQLMEKKDLIELNDQVSTDVGITFVNDKVVNSKTYFDTVYYRLRDTNNADKMNLSTEEIETINTNRAMLNSGQELFQFIKEFHDVIYSCVFNHFISIINSIMKYNVSIEPFIEKINLDSSMYDPNPADDNNNYDFMYHKYRIVFKSSICMMVYNGLCEALREFVYSNTLDVFDIDVDKFKMKVTHDNIYYTLHILLVNECMPRIECGLDIVCTKFMHTRMNFNPDDFTIPIKFIEEK